MIKKCSKCLETKDISEFYTKRNVEKTSRCKKCLRDIRKEYFYNNKEKCRLATKDYYHRVKKNYDFKMMYREAAFKNGLDGYLQTICRTCIKRKGGDIDWRFLREMWDNQSGKCAITGNEMTFSLGHGRIYSNCSVDRIDSDGIYSRNNIRLTCTGVNLIRGKMTDIQLIDFCEKILCHLKKD